VVPGRSLLGPLALVIDSARHQWEDGARALRAQSGNRARYAQLLDLVDAVRDELRKQLGQRFTLADLAALHARADDWGRDLVARSLPPDPQVGLADSTLVLDAAFHLFARGALDYVP
jgi:hypothetical protein